MIKVYTIDCPACKVLEKKLTQKNLPYEKITDRNIFTQLNIDTFPVMQIDNGPLMNYKDSNNWINQQEAINN